MRPRDCRRQDVRPLRSGDVKTWRDGACRGLDEELLSKYVRAEEQAGSVNQVNAVADGEHRRSGWKVDGGQLFPGHNYGAALALARAQRTRIQAHRPQGSGRARPEVP